MCPIRGDGLQLVVPNESVHVRGCWTLLSAGMIQIGTQLLSQSSPLSSVIDGFEDLLSFIVGERLTRTALGVTAVTAAAVRLLRTSLSICQHGRCRQGVEQQSPCRHDGNVCLLRRLNVSFDVGVVVVFD